MSTTAYDAARSKIDALHRADPTYEAHQHGEQLDAVDELQYADSMERWATHLLTSQPTDQAPLNANLVRLAARCQHLERFNTPRSSYPEGKAGYLRWRSRLYILQADKARDVLLECGVQREEAEQVHKWVRKGDLKAGQQAQNDVGSQLLEDAAVLVFLEKEITGFAQKHKEYTEDKFVEILVKYVPSIH